MLSLPFKLAPGAFSSFFTPSHQRDPQHKDPSPQCQISWPKTHGVPPTVSYSLKSLVVICCELRCVATLRLTLQRPPSKGPLETAVVAYPKTYEVNLSPLFGAIEFSHRYCLAQEAVEAVYEVYNLGARSFKKEDIILCCLTYRNVGYDHHPEWASIIPRQWETVVRHQFTEVGVFLAQDKHEWSRAPSLGQRVRDVPMIYRSPPYTSNRC